MRFFIELSYLGTNYHGWQEQPNVKTIQGQVNKVLSNILNVNIEVIGAGRTDAGVHAKQMYAHFDCDLDFEIQNLIFRANKFLDNDIVIHDVFKVKDEANSRFDAISRTYQYHIIIKKDPFRNNAYLFHKELDLKAMNQACQHILGVHDFTSFSKVNTQTYTNTCEVYYAKWKIFKNELIFTIEANRFLRNMVRAIVGTMIDVGVGKLLSEDLVKIIDAKDRCKAGTSVPAKGLFLYKVKYTDNLKI